MADLSRNDVQQAVHDATRNLQSDLQRLLNQTSFIDDINRTANTLQMEIRNIERTQQQSATVDQRLLGLLGEVRDLRLRMTNIEKFCAEMSAYMRAQYEREQEEKQFHSK